MPDSGVQKLVSDIPPDLPYQGLARIDRKPFDKKITKFGYKHAKNKHADINIAETCFLSL